MAAYTDSNGYYSFMEPLGWSGKVTIIAGQWRWEYSDANKYYKFPVPANWSGIISIWHYEYAFSPENREYTSVVSDQLNQDYKATKQISNL